MRMIVFFSCLILLCSVVCSVSFAAILNDEPKKADYDAAERYGYKPQDVRRAYKDARKRIDVDEMTRQISERLERSDFDRAALIDQAIFNMMQKIHAVLVAEGHVALAAQIRSEYEATYKMALTRGLFGTLEIGDHPPMNEWLESVHKRIHDQLDNFLCQYFRFHDIFILNHGIPVVMNPKPYTLKDYKDHFAGHLIWGYFWEHHGVAGVVSFWVVEGVCVGATWGLGLVAFVCSPIAAFTEHLVDKHVAPPIAEAIWQRAQHNN